MTYTSRVYGGQYTSYTLPMVQDSLRDCWAGLHEAITFVSGDDPIKSVVTTHLPDNHRIRFSASAHTRDGAMPYIPFADPSLQ